MTLEELTARIEVLVGKDAMPQRQRYIERFVDTQGECFQRRISDLRPYADGEYYSGYLWECLYRYERIAESDVATSVPKGLRVACFWDIHSSEKVLVPNYWKFPKDAVLMGAYGDFVDGQALLPEDLYLFDIGGAYPSVVLTHEWDEPKSRICLLAMPKAAPTPQERE